MNILITALIITEFNTYYQSWISCRYIPYKTGPTLALTEDLIDNNNNNNNMQHVMSCRHGIHFDCENTGFNMIYDLETIGAHMWLGP